MPKDLAYSLRKLRVTQCNARRVGSKANNYIAVLLVSAFWILNFINLTVLCLLASNTTHKLGNQFAHTI